MELRVLLNNDKDKNLLDVPKLDIPNFTILGKRVDEILSSDINTNKNQLF